MTTFALHTVERKPHPLLYQSNLSICKYTVLIHHIHTKCTAKAPSRYLSTHPHPNPLYTPTPSLTADIPHSSLSVHCSWDTSWRSCWPAVWTWHPPPYLRRTLQFPPTWSCLHNWLAGEPTWVCVYSRSLITTSCPNKGHIKTDNIPGTIQRTSCTHNKVTLHNTTRSTSLTIN